jgi:hypothetical protein
MRIGSRVPLQAFALRTTRVAISRKVRALALRILCLLRTVAAIAPDAVHHISHQGSPTTYSIQLWPDPSGFWIVHSSERIFHSFAVAVPNPLLQLVSVLEALVDDCVARRIKLEALSQPR